MNLSIIISTYNNAESLIRTLESVVAQDADKSLWECVVVNNASTDNTAERFSAFAQSHSDVNMRMVDEPKQGLSYGRNRGIAEAKGDYIALLDADDEWLTGYIAEVCRLMEYYPEADAYSTAFDIVNGTQRVAAPVPTTEGFINIAEEALLRRYPIIPSTATLRRDAVLRAGCFPEGMRIGEDQWLWVKMMQKGAKFCFSPMSLVRYSRTASNRSASIYRREQSAHSIEELYNPEGDTTLNEYIARIAIGKAITQSVRGGTEDARRAAEHFSYTTRSRRQLRRLRLLNALPTWLRGIVDGAYGALAWILSRRGM